MNQEVSMPAIVLLLTLLALVPLVVFAFGAVGTVPFVADRMLVALVDYVAVMLAFTGGTHWALGLWPGSGGSSMRLTAPMRLTTAVLPMIVGWVGLITAQFVSPAVALIVLIAGTLAAMLTEHQAARWQPALQPSLWLRWSVSGVVIAAMALVLLLRGVGQTFLF
jgi:Protein of unknown function (DUF3429)